MAKKHQPAGIGMTPSRTELGNFIRTRRLALDLRQDELAKMVGFSQRQISLIEIGAQKSINDRHVET